MSAGRAFARAAALAAVLVAARPAGAQVSFANLAEVRVGRDPDAAQHAPPEQVPSASRFSLFDQFSFDWTQGALRLGLRYETSVASDTLVREYGRFVRRYATWTDKRFEATVGNYDAIFGRGLVLRAFELPGVVREEPGTPQFGDSRDLDGVRLRLRDARWDLMLLQGKPRGADQDPTQPRHGNLEGATASAQLIEGVRGGANYLRLDSQSDGPGNRLEVGGGCVQIGLDPWLRRAGLGRLSLDTYVEYDRVAGLAFPPGTGSPRARPDEGYGFYGSQSVFVDDLVSGLRWGASFETKDYQNFELGVNEPPTLVREQSFALLDRTMHVLDAGQEQGYQFETRFDYRDQAEVVLNWSRAEARESERFRERYAEVSGSARGHTLTLFADDAEDETEVPAILARDTFGGRALLRLAAQHSLEIDLERQQTDQEDPFGGPALGIEDRYGSLTYGWAGRFSLAAVRQTTDNPGEATDPVTGEVSRRAYDSLQGSISFDDHHALILFWGRRRGGLACTAGTCYKVPAFDGVTARLLTRF